jgi:hypothetical protein
MKVYALKEIRVQEAAHAANYRNEISLLQRLKGKPHVIELLAAEEDNNR